MCKGERAKQPMACQVSMPIEGGARSLADLPPTRPPGMDAGHFTTDDKCGQAEPQREAGPDTLRGLLYRIRVGAEHQSDRALRAHQHVADVDRAMQILSNNPDLEELLDILTRVGVPIR